MSQSAAKKQPPHGAAKSVELPPQPPTLTAGLPMQQQQPQLPTTMLGWQSTNPDPTLGKELAFAVGIYMVFQKRKSMVGQKRLGLRDRERILACVNQEYNQKITDGAFSRRLTRWKISEEGAFERFVNSILAGGEDDLKDVVKEAECLLPKLDEEETKTDAKKNCSNNDLGPKPVTDRKRNADVLQEEHQHKDDGDTTQRNTAKYRKEEEKQQANFLEEMKEQSDQRAEELDKPMPTFISWFLKSDIGSQKCANHTSVNAAFSGTENTGNTQFYCLGCLPKTIPTNEKVSYELAYLMSNNCSPKENTKFVPTTNCVVKTHCDCVAKFVLEHKGIIPTEKDFVLFLVDWECAATSFGVDNKELEIDAISIVLRILVFKECDAQVKTLAKAHLWSFSKSADGRKAIIKAGGHDAVWEAVKKATDKDDKIRSFSLLHRIMQDDLPSDCCCGAAITQDEMLL